LLGSCCTQFGCTGQQGVLHWVVPCMHFQAVPLFQLHSLHRTCRDPYRLMMPSPSVRQVMATAPTACRQGGARLDRGYWRGQEQRQQQHDTLAARLNHCTDVQVHNGAALVGIPLPLSAVCSCYCHHPQKRAASTRKATEHAPFGRSCPRCRKQRRAGWRHRGQSCWARPPVPVWEKQWSSSQHQQAEIRMTML